MVDQIFDTEKFVDNVLCMPDFDVCAEVSSVAAGSTISLEACDGSANSLLSFQEKEQLFQALLPTCA